MSRHHEVRRSRRVAAALALVLGATLGLAACGGYDETTVPQPAPSEAEPAAPSTLQPCENDGRTETRSYAPERGSADSAEVEAIRDRGRLIAGVAADTYLLAARNSATGQIEGFDIDVVDAIARAIFGEDGHVELKVITAAERIPMLQSGDVDIVVRNMTINCERWQQVAFSAEYFHAGQKVLVADKPDSPDDITSIADLAGKRICAPTGTTSIENIQEIEPKAVPVTAGDNSACMVKFQNGEADGVSTDDTVLAGLAAQDPYAKVLDTEQLTDEPYGVATNADAVDLVRFVNQVLEDYEDDGQWQDSYDRWLAGPLGPGSPPKPLYGR